MESKHVFLLLVVVAIVPQFLGCDRSSSPEGKASESRDSAQNEQQAHERAPGGSNDTFPCWEQSWDSGDWEAFEGQVDQSKCFYTTVAGKTMLRSSCSKCSSLRLVNPENWTYRIVLSYRGRVTDCQHQWRAAAHSWSVERIVAGDILVVVFKGQVYVVVLEKMPLHPYEVLYKVGSAGYADVVNRIVLDSLKWERKRGKNTIQVGEREIGVSLTAPDIGGRPPTERFLSVWYDYPYGGPGPDYYVSEPVHIAIVHNSDVAEDGVIDLRRFRFKTWEDGLGNLCNGDEPE